MGNKEQRKPKIILFDLETLPDLPQALKVWPQLSSYPGKTLRATVSSIICAGWKEYGSNKTHCINAWDFKSWNEDVNDDGAVCREMHRILDNADAVVTHNGKRFDWKFIQTRFLKHKLRPLDKPLHIDTKSLASSNLFSFNNRLGYIGEEFVGERKLEHEGWELWVKVHQRDPQAMQTMTDYCIQDVDLLERVYDLLRPFSKAIPNHNLWKDEDDDSILCPNCGSSHTIKWGTRVAKTAVYQRMLCKSCGNYFRLDAKGKKPR